jgi:hypothetical protein
MFIDDVGNVCINDTNEKKRYFGFLALNITAPCAHDLTMSYRELKKKLKLPDEFRVNDNLNKSISDETIAEYKEWLYSKLQKYEKNELGFIVNISDKKSKSEWNKIIEDFIKDVKEDSGLDKAKPEWYKNFVLKSGITKYKNAMFNSIQLHHTVFQSLLMQSLMNDDGYKLTILCDRTNDEKIEAFIQMDFHKDYWGLRQIVSKYVKYKYDENVEIPKNCVLSFLKGKHIPLIQLVNNVAYLCREDTFVDDFKDKLLYDFNGSHGEIKELLKQGTITISH